MAELVGVFPLYADNGVPRALVHSYKGEEGICKRRALALAKALAKFDGEELVDNTSGPPIFDILAQHAKVRRNKNKRNLW